MRECASPSRRQRKRRKRKSSRRFPFRALNPVVLARVRIDGVEQIQVRRCFVPVDANGAPLPRSEWTTKSDRPYKTMEVEGDEVCYTVRDAFPGTDEGKSALQSAIAKI